MAIKHVGDFWVEPLGIEWPDNFPGYELGPKSAFGYCTHGKGDTEKEALEDCLKQVSRQGFDVNEETEERIRSEYGPTDDSETALEVLGAEDENDDREAPYFYVGIKWNRR